MRIAGEIKYFFDESKDFAHLKYSDQNGKLSLDTVIVPAAYRNRGVGSQLVRQFLSWAAIWQRDVYLAARPIGVGSGSADNLGKLYRFYSRHGFEEVNRGVTVIHMVRRFIELDKGGPPG